MRIVPEVQLEYCQNFITDTFLQDREHELYPPVKITRHPVRAGKIELTGTAVLEPDNPGMFQKTVNDAHHGNGFAHAGDPRNQHANTPDIEQNFHARPACPVERVNYFRIREAVHLCHDAAGFFRH
ncbi:MAG: hypothetical protein BWY20_01536 [Spirochaetes bacterium ADurb.Bin215]|nr:MAG: hypothetical protein BWY20_01536 [Spirochaetes bacterium ADurb.Bin215]